MSAVAPLTRTAGSRPPIPPHVATTFDPGSEGNREPYFKLVAESVRQLLKAIKNSDAQGLPFLRHLIDQRKRMVESELRLERMMQPDPVMPPLLQNLYSLDFLGKEEEPVRVYTKLLNQLDAAAAEVDRILREQKQDLSASLN